MNDIRPGGEDASDGAKCLKFFFCVRVCVGGDHAELLNYMRKGE